MARSMKTLLGGMMLTALFAAPALAQGQSGGPNQDEIARGKYLATQADCVACHTAPGGVPFAGGLPFKTPMGTIYSPNITPDKETGIGNWTDAEFLRALHQGIGKDGEHLYPAFPYTSFASISDADVQAIKAYFFSLAPVHQVNRQNEMKFPYNMRFLMLGWNLFNFSPTKIDPQAERGKYLADALGHCAECHSPRGLTMGVDQDKYLAGGSVDGWTAFNITSDKDHGIGSWSVDDIKTYLKTGNLPGKAQAAGPMAEVIHNSTQHMTDDDLTALAQYLKGVPAQASGSTNRSATGAPTPADNLVSYRADLGSSTSEAQTLFTTSCTTCHGASGQGEGNGVLPSLFHNSVVGAGTPDNLALTILDGVKRNTGFNDANMPGFRDEFSDSQIAGLVNYVRQTFGNGGDPITPDQVKNLRNGVVPPAPIDALMDKGAIAAVIVLLILLAILSRIMMRRRRPVAG